MPRRGRVTPGARRREAAAGGHRARLRREHPEWFDADAGYEPLPTVSGGHLFGFVRAGRVAVVVSRLVRGIPTRSGTPRSLFPRWPVEQPPGTRPRPDRDRRAAGGRWAASSTTGPWRSSWRSRTTDAVRGVGPRGQAVEVELGSSRCPVGRCATASRDGGRRRSTPIPAAPTTRSCSTAARRCPTRARAWQPHGVDGPSRISTTRLRVDATRRGAGARAAAARSSTSCTSARSRPEGTFDAADRAARPPGRRSASTSSSCCRSPRSPGARGWGYDGVDLFARARALRRPRRPASASSTPATRAASAWSSTSSTTTSGPSGNHLPHSAPTSPTATAPRGATPSTSTAPAPTRSARFLIDNALRLAARLPRRRAPPRRRPRAVRQPGPHFSRSWPLPSTPLAAAARPPAVPDRRVRPATTRALVSPARSAAARAARRSGTTTSTTPCTPLSPASGRATTPTSGPSAALAKTLTDGLRPRRHVVDLPGSPPRPAGRRRSHPGQRFVGYAPEPRPGRQPGRAATASPRSSPGPAQGRRRARADRRRSRRCSSWARSGAPRRRGSSSPSSDPDPGRRRRAKAAAPSSPARLGRGRDPDPQDPATFAAARLDWSEVQGEPGHGLLDWYRQLLALRRRTSGLTDARPRPR